jgi:hypothetical protein
MESIRIPEPSVFNPRLTVPREDHPHRHPARCGRVPAGGHRPDRPCPGDCRDHSRVRRRASSMERAVSSVMRPGPR